MPTVTIPDIKISPTTAMGYLITIGGGCTEISRTSSIPEGIRTAAGVIASICAALVIYTGHVMKDAGTQLAVTPDSPTPKLVPSVELPVDPQNIPVTKP